MSKNIRGLMVLIILGLVSNFSNAQWVDLNANLPGDLLCLNFSSDNTGIVGGTKGLFYTADGGTNWQQIHPTGTPQDTMVYHYTRFNSIHFWTSLSAWFAVGTDTLQNKAVIFKINSTGTNCELSYLGVQNTGLNDIKRVLNYMVTVGKRGMMIYSGNGVNWQAVSNFSSTKDLYALAVYNNQTLWVVGDNVTYKNPGFVNYGWSAYTGTPQMKRITYTTTGIIGVGADIYKSTSSGQTWSSHGVYTGFPMNGNCIKYRTSTEASIGSDHGIYRSVSGTQVWEYQPSSAGYHINDIRFFTATLGLAVGNNGKVLRTTNGGDPATPYVNYTSPNGGCIDSTLQFTNLGSSWAGYSYKWKLNSELFATTYHSQNAFHSLGNHEVRLVGTNEGISDSVSYIMPIVERPDLNKNYSVSDTLLCKSGSSNFTVHQSQVGVTYKLYRLSPLGEIDAAMGNGGDVVLSTGIITDSTSYRIRAVSSLADCGGFLEGIILIGVEKTKAKFHCQLINAEVNEPVNFFENSTQDAYYSWSFGSNANPSTSNDPDPQGVVYSSTGQTETTLIVTSLYGCTDTITASSVYIFDNSAPGLNTDCWAMNVNGGGNNASDEVEGGFDLLSDNDGNLLVAGRYAHAIFPSRSGVSHERTSDRGLVLANYNSNGVLKWMVHGSEGAESYQNPGGFLKYLKRGVDGSIYAIGGGYDTWIHPNNGDSLYLGTASFFLHFDSLGGLITYSEFLSGSYAIEGMDVDSEGNCYIVVSGFPTLFFNPTSGHQVLPFTYSQNIEFSLIKLNPDGTIGWTTTANSQNNEVYDTFSRDIVLDDYGHFYIVGCYSSPLTFHSASTQLPAFTTSQGNMGGSGRDIFIARFNTSGDFRWMRTISTDNSETGGSYSSDDVKQILTDAAGNLYVSGISDTHDPASKIAFPAAEDSIVRLPLGELFFATLDSSGYFRWAAGTEYPSHGSSIDMRIGKQGSLLSYASVHASFWDDVNFTSTDSTFVTMPVSNGSMYMTSYDTSGKLNFVNTETGLVPLSSLVRYSSTGEGGIDDDAEGNVYVTGDIEHFNGLLSSAIGDTILTPNHQDIFIAKFGAGCIDPNEFIPIVEYPDLNKTYDISDTLFCKSGSATITVHNTEPGVTYLLQKLSPLTIIDEASGNGNDVELSSGVITDDGYYRIKAISTINEQGGYLSDTILLDVEHTKASLHCHLINSEVGESVNFFQHCLEASSFEWLFGASATPSVSSDDDPTGIYYNAIGQTEVTLIATSDNGCSDSITVNGPYVFDNSDPSITSSCWSIGIDGMQIGESGNEGGYALVSDNDGNLLVGGHFARAIFPTRAGVNYGRTDGSGLFIASYNSNGVLKWLIDSKDSFDYARITNVEQSSDGSIYASGYGSNTWIYTNKGDSAFIGSGMYVFRFDSIGGLTWFTRFDSASRPFSMKIDSEGNCYVAGNESPTSFYSSTSGSQPIPNLGAQFYFAKISPDGALEWITHATSASSSNTEVNDITLDDNGHIYMIGNYMKSVTFYSVTSGQSISTPDGSLGGIESDIFVVCYSTSGNVEWFKRVRSSTHPTFDFGKGIEADSSGNIYISGGGDTDASSVHMSFPGPNNTAIELEIGKLFYASLNPSGDFRWAVGTAFTNGGDPSALSIGKSGDILSSAQICCEGNTRFVSSDGSYTTLPVNSGSFYLSSIDNTGEFNFINTETGINPSGSATEARIYAASDDVDGNIYITGSIDPLPGVVDYPFGETSITLNGRDAFIAKMGNTCIVPNDIIASIDQLTAETGVMIFPNPSNGNIQFMSSHEINSIVVKNVLGQSIASYNPNSNQYEIWIDTAGIYFVTISINGIYITQKIVVE